MDTTKKTDVWGAWATVGWGFLILIFWLSAQTVPILVVSAIRLHQNGGHGGMDLIKDLTENGAVLSLSISVGSLAALGALWLVIFLRKGAGLTEYLGLHPLKMKTFLGVLGIAAGFCLAFDLLSYFLGKDVIPQFSVKSYATRGSLALFILGMNLMGPLFEEVYFRGFLFEGFRRSRIGNMGAVLLTAAAWASLHLQYDLYQVAILFACGLIMGFLRVKTGSLWSTILFHLVMNSWATVETILYFHGFTFFYMPKP